MTRLRTSGTSSIPKQRTTTKVVSAVSVAALATVLTGCGAGSDRSEDGGGSAGSTVGVTDDTITVGAHFPLTGVAAPGYSEIPTGHQAYYDYVNANGGVHGRQIEFVYKDDGYNPTNTSKVTNELVLQDEIFAMVSGLGTPTHGAVVDYLNEEEIPDVFVSSGSLEWGDDPEARPWTFGWQTDYESEGKVIGQYIKENMPDAKVGLFLQDDDLGRDGEAGVRRFIDDQIVSAVRYTSGNTDVGPQIAELAAADVDVVVGFNVPSYTALSQLVAMRLNFKPTWFYTNVGSDPALVGSLLAQFSEGKVANSSTLLDGMLTTEYIPGVDAPDDEWVKLWNQVWEEHGGKGELTNYRIYGMSQAYTFVQALQAAGPDLTRERLVEVIENDLAGLDGPALAPLRYSSDSHLGISGMRVVEIRGGVGDPRTPVLTTDIGDAGISEDDSGAAEDGPPESGIPEAAE